MLTTLLFYIQNFWQLSLLELPSLLFWSFYTYQHCDFLLGLLQLVYLHCSIGPSSANAALAPHPHLPNLLSFFRPLCIFSLCTLTTASCSWLFLFTSCFLFLSLTLLGFFNRMLGVSEPGALNCYTLFHLIPLTSFVSRNLIYLPLSGSLDSLLCIPMAPTPNLVFFPTDVTDASGGVIIFVKQVLFFSKLSTSSLFCLAPTLII